MRHLVLTTAALLLISTSASHGYHWTTGQWGDCQVPLGTCQTDQVPSPGQKKRQVWCVQDVNQKKAVSPRLCSQHLQPPSTAVCFAYCNPDYRGDCPQSWSPWSPSRCGECVGRQRRQLECDDQVMEEQRACFSPVLCNPKEAISQPAISQPPLRPRQPEALTASFVPYLHVGAWSECQPESDEDQGVEKQPRKRSKKGKRRPTRESSGFRQLPPASVAWSPPLPAELEISFVAESVPRPLHGVQRRQVLCRGQDGETLPFRYLLLFTYFRPQGRLLRAVITPALP
jgi:hypothetical protein